MATHLRARAYQAGAFLAMLAGGIAVAPMAALAVDPPVDPTVTITNLAPADLRAGGKATLTFQVKNNNPAGVDTQDPVDIAVASTIDVLRCDGDSCRSTDSIPRGQSKQYQVTLVAGTLAAGESKTGRIEIRASVGAATGRDQKAVSVRGEDQAPQVTEVSGKVHDQDGKGLPGTKVALMDSQNHQYRMDGGADGSYRFVSSNEQPISPGTLTVAAQKEGYTPVAERITGQSGKPVRFSLTMRSTTASASPSASPTATETPTDQPSEPAATDEPAAAAPAPPSTRASDSGSSSMLFIILGGLLVAAGVGAIVLVLMRRKESDGGDGPGGPAGGVPAGGVVPPSQPRFGSVPDATRVAVRTGVGPADATMVRGPGPRPSLADAPTMMQQAVSPDDEFPDPYGAPAAIPHAGYAGAGAGWGTGTGQVGASYGQAVGAAYGAAPTPGNGYGAPGPTTRTAAPGGYGANPGGYGPGPAGYGPATNTYGSPPAPPGLASPSAAPAGPGGPGGQTYGAAPAAGQYTRPPMPAGPDGGQQHYGQPGTGQPGTGQPITGQPGTGQPGTGQPAAGRPYGGGYAADERFDEPTGRYNPNPGGPGGSLRPEPASGSFRPEPAESGYPPAVAYPAEGGYPTPVGQPPQDAAPRGGAFLPAQGGYEPAGGYPAAGGGYGAGQPEQSAGYGSWAPGGGIDSGNAYAASPTGGYGSGYAAPAPNALDNATSYDAHGAYGRPEGYGPAVDRGESPRDAQQGGRHGTPSTASAAESTHPGQRRSLDWLDD